MQTIQINNIEAENFINSNYGNDTKSLVDDFLLFVKTELVASDIKKGFDEVDDFAKGNIHLTDANDFLSELKSGY